MDAPALRGLQVEVIRRSGGHGGVVVFGMCREKPGSTTEAFSGWSFGGQLGHARSAWIPIRPNTRCDFIFVQGMIQPNIVKDQERERNAE